MSWARALGGLLLVTVVGASVWAVRPPGWAPLSRLGGVPAIGADCGPKPPWGETCAWRAPHSDHVVARRQGGEQVVWVRHKWWVSDSLQWERLRDSVRSVLSSLRPRQERCKRLQRTVSGVSARRLAMRGYAIEYYEYQWPASTVQGTGYRPRWGVELYGAALHGADGFPPCERTRVKRRLMTLREMETAVVRWIARVWGAE